MASDFRNLVAYRQAHELANELYAIVARWPSFETWSIGLQLVRAIDSVGANIAESTGRGSRADERRFLLIARGSMCESEHWIACAEERGLLRTGTSERLGEVARTLNGLIRKREQH